MVALMSINCLFITREELSIIENEANNASLLGSSSIIKMEYSGVCVYIYISIGNMRSVAHGWGFRRSNLLRGRLDNWLNKIHTALLSIEARTPNLIAS